MLALRAQALPFGFQHFSSRAATTLLRDSDKVPELMNLHRDDIPL